MDLGSLGVDDLAGDKNDEEDDENNEE